MPLYIFEFLSIIFNNKKNKKINNIFILMIKFVFVYFNKFEYLTKTEIN